MFFIPKIEKITRDATLLHFFLMFGYRIFSLYFPLFLVAKGFSLPQVGYTYLLIYLPIAIFSPIVGFLNHRINPAILASIGILGYGFYALGMILFPNLIIFYLFQIILGISAAFFFVSMRAVLISSPLENYNRAFGWFYSASYYAGAVAPVVGALFIWKFNFIGVFTLSLVIQILTSIYCFLQLKRKRIKPLDKYFNLERFSQNYEIVFRKIKEREILLPILISFSVLLMSGFYQGFGILSLKDVLHWSHNTIITITAILCFLFSSISLYLIRRLEKFKSEKSIFQGGIIAGIFSTLFGIFLPYLNFLLYIIISLFQSAGALVCDSGRSGLVSQKLKENPEEAGAIDTIFSPLGTAFGALISGVVIGFLGYQFLFILGGLFVLIVVILGKRFAKLENLK
jgi:MFS family permease